MAVGSAALLKRPEVHHGAHVLGDRTLSQSLSDIFVIRIRSRLSVARRTQAPLQHVLLQKPDELPLRHDVTVPEAYFCTESLCVISMLDRSLKWRTDGIIAWNDLPSILPASNRTIVLCSSVDSLWIVLRLLRRTREV